MRLKIIWTASLALLCFCLAAAGETQAHKLMVSAVPEAEGTLTVQAFFPDGTPAQEVPVAVSSTDGHPILSGKTNAQGLVKIAPLAPGAYRVEVGDPLGHRAETRGVLPGATPPQAAPSPRETTPAAAPPPLAGAPAPPGEAFPWGNLLAGLGFIFGVAAFILVLKLRAEVRKLAPRD
jgi:hypothetical protein